MRKTYILLFVAALATAALAAGANGALLKVGKLVVRTDSTFTPDTLPKSTFAPVFVHGTASIRSTDGGPPPALSHLVIALDRNNKLETHGLPSCDPAQIANTTPLQARNLCPRAIVATGHISSRISRPGERAFGSTSPLTAFNGPKIDGDATVIVHSYMQFPQAETYVVTARLIGSGGNGSHGYHLVADLPPIAGGYGVLTHGDVKIGRRYKFRGRTLSYTSARCLSGILFVHGRFVFADGTVLEGSIFRPCSVRGS
jgi:hypothetical protein